MYTFFISLAILLLGYYFYSRYVERIFGADPNKKTPALTMADGVDYVAMPGWKIFLIQFLNIAGLGPIFGAIAGAMWGPVAFLWIVLGSLLGGGVHDYFSGMLSMKHNGMSIAEITGKYLGKGSREFMLVFTVVVLILVGAVFVSGPAKILGTMFSGFGGIGNWFDMRFWIFAVLAYYILATLLPVDKIIGRLYPVFGIALFLMAVLVFISIMVRGVEIPELTLSNFYNQHHDASKFPTFPMLFITIACGAVSGFHATQSPMMARCITNEKQGRRIFYGAMIAEAIVAMIWAAVSMCFFGNVGKLNEVMVSQGGNAAYVVNVVSGDLLGRIGSVLVILGVVIAPITSGDTAFRGARIIIADFLKWKQNRFIKRLLISLPLFVVGYLLTLIDFAIVWRYFSWANQTIAAVTLWTVTSYLLKEGKNFIVAMVPAIFMTVVVVSYILLAPEGFRLPYTVSIWSGVLVALCYTLWIFYSKRLNSNLRVFRN